MPSTQAILGVIALSIEQQFQRISVSHKGMGECMVNPWRFLVISGEPMFGLFGDP